MEAVEPYQQVPFGIFEEMHLETIAAQHRQGVFSALVSISETLALVDLFKRPFMMPMWLSFRPINNPEASESSKSSPASRQVLR